MYYFSTPICVYIDPNALSKDIDYSEVLTPYVPTSAEAESMLEEYCDWVGQVQVNSDSDLIRCLTDLDLNKNEMLARVKAQANAFENNLNKSMYFTSSLGFRCNADKRTLSNLQNLVELMDNDGSVDYRDYDNNCQTVVYTEVKTLLNECRLNSVRLYQQKWAIQEKISAAESFDDLHAIDTTIVGADFSKEE